MVPELQNITIDNLLRPEGWDWDLDVLNDIFLKQDMDKILRIPSSCSMKEDRWFWFDDEKGVYTVKSGYKSLTGLFNSYATSQVEFNGQKLWNLLIPPKVKNFIWRVYYNCLRTLDNLQRRQVDVNSQCSFCQAGDETLNHAIMSIC